MSCSQSNELTGFMRKFRIEERSNSDVKVKKYWHKNLYNTDKRGRNNIVYGEDINTDFMIQMDKRYKRNTEQEREQNNPILERFFGMNQMIRLMSIDYPVMFIFYNYYNFSIKWCI